MCECVCWKFVFSFYPWVFDRGRRWGSVHDLMILVMSRMHGCPYMLFISPPPAGKVTGDDVLLRAAVSGK